MWPVLTKARAAAHILNIPRMQQLAIVACHFFHCKDKTNSYAGESQASVRAQLLRPPKLRLHAVLLWQLPLNMESVCCYVRCVYFAAGLNARSFPDATLGQELRSF